MTRTKASQRVGKRKQPELDLATVPLKEDAKYDVSVRIRRIRNDASSAARPEDEPEFILRAKTLCALRALSEYLSALANPLPGDEPEPHAEALFTYSRQA